MASCLRRVTAAVASGLCAPRASRGGVLHACSVARHTAANTPPMGHAQALAPRCALSTSTGAASSDGEHLFEDSSVAAPRVLVYGDSNSWGADPVTGRRFARHVRWPGVLQFALGLSAVVEECNLNGRTCVFDDPITDWLPPNDPHAVNGRAHLMATLHAHKPLSVVILALGVNDLKVQYGANPAQIANGAGLLVDDILTAGRAPDNGIGTRSLSTPAGEGDSATKSEAPQVMLISPAPVVCETELNLTWGFAGGVERSRALAAEYARVAAARGVHFFDAGAVAGVVCSEVDGIHLGADAHRALGEAIARPVAAILADRVAARASQDPMLS